MERKRESKLWMIVLGEDKRDRKAEMDDCDDTK
jgi:hypothetical protein